MYVPAHIYIRVKIRHAMKISARFDTLPVFRLVPLSSCYVALRGDLHTGLCYEDPGHFSIHLYRNLRSLRTRTFALLGSRAGNLGSTPYTPTGISSPRPVPGKTCHSPSFILLYMHFTFTILLVVGLVQALPQTLAAAQVVLAVEPEEQQCFPLTSDIVQYRE